MKKESQVKKIRSILLFLIIFSSVSLFFSTQANNNLSVENSEELKLSSTGWTTTEVVSTEGGVWQSSSVAPTIAVDDVGNVHVAWEDRTYYDDSGEDSDIFYKRWDAVDNIWTMTEVVSTESTWSSRDPTIAVNGAGNVHVAWYDATNYDDSGEDFDIFYKRWDAVGNIWTTTEVVSTESTWGGSDSPTIAVDGIGNIHVAWRDYANYDNSGYNWDIFYKRWDAVGNIWTTTEVVSTESTWGSDNPTIAVDDTGNVHVAWRKKTYQYPNWDSDIFYKRWNVASNTWTTTEEVSTESTGLSWFPSIAVDSTGNVHVTWQGETYYPGPMNLDIFYKRWNSASNTWTTTEVVSTESTGIFGYPTIAVDDIGNVHVAWEDETQYDNSGWDPDIFYKRWDAACSMWTRTEVISTESGYFSFAPSIAVDGAGNVHVAWDDLSPYIDSGWDRDIFYKRLSVPETDFVHLIYGTNSGPVNLDPHYAWESASIDVIDQVVETLYAYDLLDPELAPIPRLASDFGTWSIDGLNYTVPLRMGVTFHDGTPFNAPAVKWNFDRLAYFMNIDGSLPPGIPTTQFSTLYLWDDGTPIINRVEIVDEYTVRFVLNKPFVPLEALLSFSGSGIISPASTPEQSYIDTATGNLVGTGPFVYDNYEVGVKVTMHAYENYWAGTPHIDELTFSIIPDSTARNLALLDGTIDFVKTPQNSFLQAFRDDPDITLVDAGQDATIWFLGMNNHLIPVEMRKAISYAVNYSYIIDDLMGGEAVRLKSPIPLGLTYANWAFEVPTYDTVYARNLMQSMGFGVGWDTSYPGVDDALWDAASFATYNYTYNIGNTLREDILVLIQDNLGKIGITVVDNGITGQDYFNRLYDHKDMLELFWLGWAPDYNDPSNNVNELFSKDSVQNFAQVDDDLVQEWMEEALITINPAERKVLYDKIQQRLIEVVFPWAWGFVRKNYDAHSSRFTEFQSNPMNKVWFYSVDKDSDGDGLSNCEEISIGTDPLFWDTDGDGISDGEEVLLYGTNPLEPVDTYTPSGPNIEVIDENTGTSIEFEKIETPGVTTIEESEIEPKIPGGFMIAGLPGTYISITTTASYSGSMIIGIPYDGSMLSVEEENALFLVHWNSTTNQWENITLFVDTFNDIIFGEAENLSIFTILLDIAFLLDWLQEIIDDNLGTPLEDKIEDVLDKVETAYEELSKDPPDYQATLGNLEGAVGDLEAVVKDGLLNPTEGRDFMDLITAFSRQLVVNNINDAIAYEGNQDIIDEALEYLDEGDTLREQGKFKDAINKFKDALAKAKSCLP